MSQLPGLAPSIVVLLLHLYLACWVISGMSSLECLLGEGWIILLLLPVFVKSGFKAVYRGCRYHQLRAGREFQSLIEDPVAKWVLPEFGVAAGFGPFECMPSRCWIDCRCEELGRVQPVNVLHQLEHLNHVSLAATVAKWGKLQTFKSLMVTVALVFYLWYHFCCSFLYFLYDFMGDDRCTRLHV